jgi:hypothetical protein
MFSVIVCHFLLLKLCPGLVSSVGIATYYGLDGPGIEFLGGGGEVARFPHPSRPALGADPASYTMGTLSFPGVKRPGGVINHPPSSNAEVKETIELYVYSPSGSSCMS